MSYRARKADRDGAFSGNKAERAIIDIGSNTVRMVVYGGAMRAPTVLLNEKVAARLGREIAETRRIPEEAIDIALGGLRRFVLLLEDLGVSDVEVVATAASRDAENGEEFLSRVRALGLEPRLLSGEDEARISAAGVIGAFPGARGVVADLGGGSLELVRIADGESSGAASLPLGTLRLHEYGTGKKGDLRKELGQVLKSAGWNEDLGAPLYLVGGTWRAMAVYAMQQRDYPLTDPHGFELSAKEADRLAQELADCDPEKLHEIPRISTMRSGNLPAAAVLLQALLKRLSPTKLVFSSWGLREGLLYDRLPPHGRSQDPLLAGVANFSAQRGAPPTLATRVAGWTVDAIPPSHKGSERLRLAATMLALASMQIEPNLRTAQAVDWALHKRWLATSAEERAMLAAAVCANGNHLDLPPELSKLASAEALETAICWGLTIRLCRRIGGRSRRLLQVSRLRIEGQSLVLVLQESHKDLLGAPTEKDMKLLGGRLGLEPEVKIVPDIGDYEAPEMDAVVAGSAFPA